MGEGSESRTPSAAADLALVQRILGGSRIDLPALAERLRCIARTLQLLDQKYASSRG